jgi:putative endonuclease
LLLSFLRKQESKASAGDGFMEALLRKQKQGVKSLDLKQFYVYILASKKNGTLYTGITSNLVKRVYEHRNNLVDGFTKKYHVHRLVYYEKTDNPNSAITREKQMKKWKRQ